MTCNFMEMACDDLTNFSYGITWYLMKKNSKAIVALYFYN